MKTPKPWSFAVVALAGWLNRKQQDVVEYLREENRVLLDRMGKRRLRLSDVERRRLAIRGKALGRGLIKSARLRQRRERVDLA